MAFGSPCLPLSVPPPSSLPLPPPPPTLPTYPPTYLYLPTLHRGLLAGCQGTRTRCRSYRGWRSGLPPSLPPPSHLPPTSLPASLPPYLLIHANPPVPMPTHPTSSRSSRLSGDEDQVSFVSWMAFGTPAFPPTLHPLSLPLTSLPPTSLPPYLPTYLSTYSPHPPPPDRGLVAGCQAARTRCPSCRGWRSGLPASPPLTSLPPSSLPPTSLPPYLPTYLPIPTHP